MDPVKEIGERADECRRPRRLAKTVPEVLGCLYSPILFPDRFNVPLYELMLIIVDKELRKRRRGYR